MAALGLTTKIISVIVAGVAGSGIVAGSIISSSNNQVKKESVDIKDQIEKTKVSSSDKSDLSVPEEDEKRIDISS
ncbi:hypothetical protein [Mycoplasma suis]|uniref:hypothetical protein n=1 Tax=Mycoplasma suis TaxID=57372 RepID=UPI0002D8FD56|nr:hypothetical protein [Mycoplasma suis]